MAEGTLSDMASKLLDVMRTAAFEMAFERVHSIWGASEDLWKIKHTIERIQPVLVDAYRRSHSDREVKGWMKRVRDVLCEAEDLFDQVLVNDDSFEQEQMKGKKRVEKVRDLFSKLNSIVSNRNIAKKVKAIGERLYEISTDIAQFGFAPYHNDNPTSFGKMETHSFVYQSHVFGRDDDRNSIIELLFDESNVGKSCPDVIAVVGMVGIGKTTLAQLIYNTEEVQKNFENRWWVCLSNATDSKQVVRMLFEAIANKNHTQSADFSLNQLELMIRESLTSSGDYLLILDDVHDICSHGQWSDIMRLLINGVSAARSKIIITTEILSVPRAMQIDERKIYTLNGLSDDDSWQLFKRIAFYDEEQLNDPTRLSLGREIMKKCANVPLAIRSIASLLYARATVQEWWSIENEKLINIDPSVRSVLKLSYDHLPSKLKQCFAYCSLFPKDHLILRDQLIYLWLAQGYVQRGDHSTLEEAGNQCFMELIDVFFFQEIKVDYQGEIISCKMHDFVHELAQHVAGVDTVMLTQGSNQFSERNRHLSVVCEIDDSWNILPPLLEDSQLRSFFMFGSSCSSVVLDQQVMKLRLLRTLDLHALNIDKVPSSIGQLKYLRYLNLSQNTFANLPDSITMLVNLLTLDISSCRHLQSLPDDFRKLIKLRHLDISYCDNLWYMPPGFGELTSLVHLSDFKVSKHGGGNSKSSGLDALAKLNLTGKVAVTYDRKGAWGREELMLKRNHIPETVKVLSLSDYPSMELPCWWKETGNAVMYKLEHLVLIRCGQVKHLPPLKCLRHLRSLQLYHLQELEYIDDSNVGSATGFFGSLEKLEMVDLPKLKYWSRGTEEARAQIAAQNDEHIVEIREQQLFCSLLKLEIKSCYSLESMPPCPHLKTLCLEETRKELVTQLLPTCSFPSPHSSAPSSSLEDITVNGCNELTSFPGERLTNLRKLEIRNCTSLKILKLASYDLEEITISNSPVTELWCCREGEQGGVDCHFLKKLRLLNLDEIPEEDTLPDWLQQIRALGKLKIKEW